MSDSFEDESRKHFNRAGLPTVDDMKLGCLQRIASATEAMAQRHTELMDDLERRRRHIAYLQTVVDRLERQNAALRGVITRMKRRQT